MSLCHVCVEVGMQAGPLGALLQYPDSAKEISEMLWRVEDGSEGPSLLWLVVDRFCLVT